MAYAEPTLGVAPPASELVLPAERRWREEVEEISRGSTQRRR
jgi:hypothetical protein